MHTKLLVAMLAAGGMFAAPLKVLIITGQTDLPYHDWRVTTPFIRQALEDTGRFDVRVTEEPRALSSAALAGYDVLILNYNGPRWGTEAERAVEQFVRSGKGMLAFHGVSYGPFYGQDLQTRRMSGAPWAAYAGMMGMSWKLENVGHAVRHVFSVKWVDRDHPISRGLDPSFLANDELYHKMDFKPNAHVLATAYDDPKRGGTGKEEPIVWTVPFGSGRVVHTSLGHDLSAMVQPGFLAVLARGTEWAATGRVTLPARIPPRAEAAGDAVRVLVVTGGHPYPTSFYSLFEGYSDIRWSHATTLAEAYTPDMKDRWDTVVLHDLHNEIGEKEKQNLRAFVESGKGVVSLHHAIADYPAWPWWYEDVIGGEYFVKAMAGHGAATFHEGVEMIARPVDRMAAHPVLRGVGPIVVRDEAYRGMWHSPKITVLMTTDHPENDAPVVYLGPHARTVYIQLGHDTETFRHPGYRRLLHNAILWSAGRLN